MGAKLALLLMAAVVLTGAAGPKKPTPLFADDQPIRVTIRGPISAIVTTPAPSRTPRPAILELVSPTVERHAILLSPRGLLRRTKVACQFPPLRVEFTAKPSKTVAVRAAEKAEARHALPQRRQPSAVRAARICGLPDAQRAQLRPVFGRGSGRSIMSSRAGARSPPAPASSSRIRTMPQAATGWRKCGRPGGSRRRSSTRRRRRARRCSNI